MRKRLILLPALIGGLCAPIINAQTTAVEPELVEDLYILKMSQNGQWLSSSAGDASIYSMETGQDVRYDGCTHGLGNSIANNGMSVGNENDRAVLMYDGKILYPEAFNPETYWFSDINAITSDGSRICGIVNQLGTDESDQGGNLTLYVPFVAEIDASGNVGEPTMLPYPTEDFFGSAPQYVTAVWISDDGTKIAGEVIDWRGMYTYPIIYVEGANGEWSYELPTKDLFNPSGIELPANPWINEPPYPEPENFMTPTARTAYLEAYEKYSQGLGPEPDVEEYMSDQEFDEFLNAYNTYNQWFYSSEQLRAEYVKIYDEVLQTTPTFTDNEIAMQPDGAQVAYKGYYGNADGSLKGYVFVFKPGQENYYKTYDLPNEALFPCQMLDSGMMIVTLGQAETPTSYFLLPGKTEFISTVAFFQDQYPSISEWITANLIGGSGVLTSNPETTFFTGALTPEQWTEYDDSEGNFWYSTYFLVLPEPAGIEALIAEPENGVYTVYNLNGVKVLETKNSAEVAALPGGLYIINGKKILLAK